MIEDQASDPVKGDEVLFGDQIDEEADIHRPMVMKAYIVKDDRGSSV
jgi:hypothetical protein